MKIIKAKETEEGKLTEMADYMLHEKTLEEFKCLDINKEADILVLGSGQGALEEKLLQEGYNNITAVDLNERDYKLKDKVKFIKWDLNNDFKWENKKYDVIFAMEIIEHLESPPHFIRESSKILKNRGSLILTTPNILEKGSRLNFLIFGRLSGFDESAIETVGHITPIFPHLLKFYLKNNNMEIVKRVYNRKFSDYLVVYDYRSYIVFILKALVTFLIRVIPKLNKEYYEGAVNIYVIKKLN